MIYLEYLGYFFIVIGVVFLFLGALGIYRMPDVFTRMQAGTKATTLGALGTILGVGLVQPEWFWKTLIIALFIGISNPISSHAVARASHKSGLRPFVKKEDMDALADIKEAKEVK